MTTPSPLPTDEDARESLRRVLRGYFSPFMLAQVMQELDEANAAAGFHRSVVSTPPSEAPAWMDKHGDVWIFPGGGDTGWSFETQSFSRAHIEKKWGPLIPLVPAVPVLPTEPAAPVATLGHRFRPDDEGNCWECGNSTHGITAPTEPEEKR